MAQKVIEGGIFHVEMVIQGWAIWKCMEDLLIRTILPPDYANQYSPTLYCTNGITNISILDAVMIPTAFLNVPVDSHLVSNTVRATKNVPMDALVTTTILIIAMMLVFPITMT